MSHPIIFADFHNADKQGRLPLNCVGTIEYLNRQNIKLPDGQLLTLYSEELEVGGVGQYSEEESLWVAAIDWKQIRQLEDIIVEATVWAVDAAQKIGGANWSEVLFRRGDLRRLSFPSDNRRCGCDSAPRNPAWL